MVCGNITGTPEIGVGSLGGYFSNYYTRTWPCAGSSLYGEVQCFIGNGHMGPSALAPPPIQTDTTENITFLQLRWRAGKKDRSGAQIQRKVCSHVTKFGPSPTFGPKLFCIRKYNFGADGSVTHLAIVQCRCAQHSQSYKNRFNLLATIQLVRCYLL